MLLNNYAVTQDKFQRFKAKVMVTVNGVCSDPLNNRVWRPAYSCKTEVRYDQSRASIRPKD
jgi:hypothetical protein